MPIGICVAVITLLFSGQALAFDAGLRAPVLADPSPGAVSVPFQIPIIQPFPIPQPEHFEIAIEGFELDPEPMAGSQIGSLDLYTDSGPFGDKAIYSNGPGEGGLRTWTLAWQLADPIVATVEDGVSLDQAGNRVAAPDSTLISFSVTENYHGFRLTGLRLRFNQQNHGLATERVGAVNPPREGSYLIRSRIQSVAPQSAVKVSSVTARIGFPAPKTKLKIGVNRQRVRVGGRVRFALRTVNGTSDKVGIWRGRKLLRQVRITPRSRAFYWRATPAFKGRRVQFRFNPANGPERKVAVRVNR